MNKKTLFITINRAIIARNILSNNHFIAFAKEYNIVAFVPPHIDKEFINMFQHNISFEILQKRNLTGWKQILDNFFISLHKACIYNDTIELRTKYGLLKRDKVKGKWIRHFIQKYVFGYGIGKSNMFKKLLHTIDTYIFFHKPMYTDFIKKYNPSLVFITNIASEEEIQLLVDCQKQGIPSVGMVKSWDSTSKFGFRGRVDHVAVWGEYMKKEFIQYQQYKESDISIVGIPQFDSYSQPPIISKKVFFQTFNLDESRPFIFFGSEGPVCEDEEYVIDCLLQAIQTKGSSLYNFQLFIRPHFGYKHQIDRFISYATHPNVVVDTMYSPSTFPDGMEYTLSSINNMHAAMIYAHAVITSASTLVLDAIANGVYPILFAFDKEQIDYKDSVERLYQTAWFKEIEKMGLQHKAFSKDLLIDMTANVSKKRQQYQKNMESTIRYFCYAIDGKSGSRLTQLLRKYC